MNAVLLKYQLTTCGVLGAILVFEMGVGQISLSHLHDTLSRNLDTKYQADALPVLELAKQQSDSYNSIIDRPLFIEGRRPLPEEANDDAEAAAETGQLDDWELIGLYSTDSNPLALFRHKKEAKKYQRLSEEQTISGWQLIQILADKAVLQLGGQQKSIMLRKPRKQLKPAMPHKRAPQRTQPFVPPQGAPPNTDNLENNDNDR